MMSDKISITLVTGNFEKVREFQQIIGDTFDVNNQKYDIEEIQGLPKEVASHKAYSIANILGKPVITEDTCLYFKELPGLGAFVKFLEIDSDGNHSAENQCKNLQKIAKGCDDKTLIAVCIIAYCEPGGIPELFVGQYEGTFCSLESGLPKTNHKYFGWDPVMFDEASGKSFAQMTAEEKNLISHRSKALNDFKMRFPTYIVEKQKLNLTN